jgi:hypothetical protein
VITGKAAVVVVPVSLLCHESPNPPNYLQHPLPRRAKLFCRAISVQPQGNAARIYRMSNHICRLRHRGLGCFPKIRGREGGRESQVVCGAVCCWPAGIKGAWCCFLAKPVSLPNANCSWGISKLLTVPLEVIAAGIDSVESKMFFHLFPSACLDC